MNSEVCADHQLKCINLTLTDVNPTAIRKAKIVYNLGLSECNRVKIVKHEISLLITPVLG